MHPASDLQARIVRRGCDGDVPARRIRAGCRQGLRLQHGRGPAHPGRGPQGRGAGDCAATGSFAMSARMAPAARMEALRGGGSPGDRAPRIPRGASARNGRTQ